MSDPGRRSQTGVDPAHHERIGRRRADTGFGHYGGDELVAIGGPAALREPRRELAQPPHIAGARHIHVQRGRHNRPFARRGFEHSSAATQAAEGTCDTSAATPLTSERLRRRRSCRQVSSTTTRPPRRHAVTVAAGGYFRRSRLRGGAGPLQTAATRLRRTVE